MKYIIKNLRTNKIEVEYNNFDEAECFVKIAVKFKNDRKNINEKRWTKKDFKIIEEMI